MKYYVDCNAKPYGDGTKEAPLKRIGEAARIAEAGDTVLVAPGIYREHVDPANGGTEENRILYRSVEERKAVITGAEPVTGWTQYSGDVYCLRLPYSYFGAYNPYTDYVYGDWLDGDVRAHTGEVYFNDKSMYEKQALEEVLEPKRSNRSWDREFSIYTWYTEQDPETEDTLIYANFHGADPNEENVEINVRRYCFYPLREHVNYITLSGFCVTRAATQWAPPTALQEGMIGPHWSKGWIIENCEVSHSKCAGISLGKYKQDNNDNKWSKVKWKNGTQTQRDCVLIAQIDGFSKETIGSHIVRNCEIHDCGQTGIVGNLGCVFSLIENNHIHHINHKQELRGAEIGGIKFHAPIDVIIRNNRFHHCTRGVWLDWQAQGTRVSANLFYANTVPEDYLLEEKKNLGLGLGEDLFIEISHGPTLIDNNILLSERAIKYPAQGCAFVHNLIAGSITAVGVGVKNGATHYDSTRYTPYHLPHRTEITGFMSVLHGDTRFYNNIFVQQKVREDLREVANVLPDRMWDTFLVDAGTFPFDDYMTREEWLTYFEGYVGEGNPDRDRYYMPLPVWFGGNAYYNGARACRLETDAFTDNENEIYVNLKEEQGAVYLETNLGEFLPEGNGELIDSDTLGRAFEPEERFEEPDGSDIVFDTDYFGQTRGSRIFPGPFADYIGNDFELNRLDAGAV